VVVSGMRPDQLLDIRYAGLRWVRDIYEYQVCRKRLWPCRKTCTYTSHTLLTFWVRRFQVNVQRSIVGRSGKSVVKNACTTSYRLSASAIPDCAWEQPKWMVVDRHSDWRINSLSSGDTAQSRQPLTSDFFIEKTLESCGVFVVSWQDRVGRGKQTLVLIKTSRRPVKERSRTPRQLSPHLWVKLILTGHWLDTWIMIQRPLWTWWTGDPDWNMMSWWTA